MQQHLLVQRVAREKKTTGGAAALCRGGGSSYSFSLTMRELARLPPSKSEEPGGGRGGSEAGGSRRVSGERRAPAREGSRFDAGGFDAGESPEPRRTTAVGSRRSSIDPKRRATRWVGFARGLEGGARPSDARGRAAPRGGAVLFGEHGGRGAWAYAFGIAPEGEPNDIGESERTPRSILRGMAERDPPARIDRASQHPAGARSLPLRRANPHERRATPARPNVCAPGRRSAGRAGHPTCSCVAQKARRT